MTRRTDENAKQSRDMVLVLSFCLSVDRPSTVGLFSVRPPSQLQWLPTVLAVIDDDAIHIAITALYLYKKSLAQDTTPNI
jgi:hypothetical protein